MAPTPRGRRRTPHTTDLTADLPRLPEVNFHEESNEVRVDPRSLSPGRDLLSGARALPMPSPAHPRALKPAVPQRPHKAVSRGGLQQNTPRPPPRSAQRRDETAGFSSLIGGRYQILTRIGQGGIDRKSVV